MTTEDLFLELQDTIADKLLGMLTYDGIVLKWEYDGIDYIHDGLEEHLDAVAFDDKEIISENIDDDFIITEPEIHDTFIYFYIEQ